MSRYRFRGSGTRGQSPEALNAELEGLSAIVGVDLPLWVSGSFVYLTLCLTHPLELSHKSLNKD